LNPIGLQPNFVLPMKQFLTLSLILLILTLGRGLTAQDLPSTKPKIGLALSGGSAHGFAHVGVIKYLEELGIGVDYVTGTSMGSVIGGLYAMGYEADEIATIAGELNWDLLMSNRVPLDEVAPIEKPFHDRIPISALWKNSSFRLPRGFIRGQKLDLVVSKVYSPAYQIEDFDDFQIPFRCVAIDIEDGSIDVLDKGYIGNAIRASMAIPTVFPPKEVNGRLYVDGGLLRNFPVQEVKDMGADLVIGVYVGSEMAPREDLYSMFDILKQSASMANLIDSDAQKKMADILILPDVKDHGTFDFSHYQHCIELGYAAAREQADKLKELAKKLADYPTQTKKKKLEYPESLRFSEIKISNAEPALEKMIKGRLHIEENFAVTLDEVEQNLSRVYGTKNFSRTSYSFFSTEREKVGIEIDVEEVDPFSLGINVNRFELYNTALIISGEARNVLGRPSNLRIDARVSDFPGIQGYYFLRIPSNPSLLVKTTAKLERSQLPFFHDKLVNRIYVYEQGALSMEFIKEWKNKYLFRGGYSYLHDEIKPETFDEKDVLEYETDRGALFLGLEYNDLDKQPYPENGMTFGLSGHWVFGNELKIRERDGEMPFLLAPDERSYQKVDLSFEKYFSLSEKFVVEFGVKGRYDFGSNLLDNYRVGGPSQGKALTYGFMGLNDSEVLFGSHINIRSALRLKLNKSFNLSPVFQWAYGKDALSLTYDRADKISLVGGGIQLGYDAPIGPVNFEMGYCNLRDEVVLNLGLGYRHIF